MQYLHVIHSAAATFYWGNMAQYDFVFRKRMGQKPHRNWACTDVQLWTKTMVNPLNKSYNNSNYSTPSSGKKDWREIACWRYNKRKCHKVDCRFKHRCSFCSSFSHIYLNCLKKPKRGDKPRGEDKKKDAKAESQCSHINTDN